MNGGLGEKRDEYKEAIGYLTSLMIRYPAAFGTKWTINNTCIYGQSAIIKPTVYNMGNPETLKMQLR